MKINKLAIIPLVLLLAGCASDSKRYVDLKLNYVTANSVPAGQINANDQAQLANAATSVGQSLQQLSAVQKATHPRARVAKAANAGGMSKVASISWNGPVEPIVDKIASSAGYHLRVIGKKPAIPVLVSIDAQNQTLGSILRDVTYQASKKADVVVYSSSKTVELRYYNN